jgi:hypothetical protein
MMSLREYKKYLTPILEWCALHELNSELFHWDFTVSEDVIKQPPGDNSCAVLMILHILADYRNVSVCIFDY